MVEETTKKYKYLETKKPVSVLLGGESVKISHIKRQVVETGQVFDIIRLERAFQRFNGSIDLPASMTKEEIVSLSTGILKLL